MKKVTIVFILILIIAFASCKTTQNRYEKCSHFTLKNNKTEKLNAGI